MFQALTITAARMLCTEAEKQWIQYNKRHTRRTQGHYTFVIHNFFGKLSIKNIESLTTCHITLYISHLLSQGLTNRTCNAHLTVIKSFCRFISLNYELPNIAKPIPMMREAPPKQRFLTFEEYKAVLIVCNRKQADFVRFLANTGLRASEFENLKPDNIKDDFIILTGKGNRRRMIPLNSVVRDILKRYLETLINLTKSRRVQYKLCCRLASKAEIPRFGPHALRHYFATEMLAAGVNIAILSKILGHSSVKTTESIYIHFQPAHLKGATDCLCQ